MPIAVPADVEVTIDGNTVTAKGPKGELTRTFKDIISIKQEEAQILVTRPDDSREARSLHGLTRTLVANMIEGVSKGFSKKLQLVGVGYRAALKGSDLGPDTTISVCVGTSKVMPSGHSTFTGWE